MGLIVQKYGGTSVGSVEKIQSVARKIKKSYDDGARLVVAVSARSGETNRLLELAAEFHKTPSPRELDMLLAIGEQETIALLTMAIQSEGAPAISYTGHQVRILTDSSFGKARIRAIDNSRIIESLDAGKIVVIAGFQGMDDAGEITTLGRGGSDTTAVALAVSLEADECQIYTDVDGVYTADPRIEPKARRIPVLSFEEMLEMASLGAKVLQIRAVEFASKHRLALRVCQTDGQSAGTLIKNEESSMEKVIISGIAHNPDEAKMSVLGVPDKPGVAYRILKPVSDANLEVDMIVQSVSAEEGLTNFSFTVHRRDFAQTRSILEKVQKEVEAQSIQCDDTVVKVSMVGIGMRSHAGIATKMFAALHAEGINIQMISTSEIKISVIIDEKYLELAVRTLHRTFELDNEK